MIPDNPDIGKVYGTPIGEILTGGLAKVRTQELSCEWTDEYGFKEHRIIYGDGETGYKAIFRNTDFINITTEGYQLIPNEEVLKAADEAAMDLGLVKFHEFGGDWYCKMDKHAILEKNRLHALYAYDEPFKVHWQQKDDTINIGVGVHNSIDGSLSLGAGGFTFRHACSNMTWMGYKKTQMDFDDRETVAWQGRRHTWSLTLDTIKETIADVVERTKGVLNVYEGMSKVKLTEPVARKLVDEPILPRKVLPDYIEPFGDKVRLLAIPTLWETYNDITELIWHNAKASWETKKDQCKALHRALEVRI